MPSGRKLIPALAITCLAVAEACAHSARPGPQSREEEPLTRGISKTRGGATEEDAPLPRFEWPPPKASAQEQIPDKWLRAGSRTTLEDVSTKLEKALALASFRSGEWSYYSVPGGFALATHLEQIESDGTPVPGKDRWNPGARSLASLSIVDFIAALASAPEGTYRAIVFVVTDAPLQQGPDAPNAERIESWSGSGAPGLPSALSRAAYSERHRTYALVYQFGKRGRETSFFARSAISGEQHLQKSGLWRPLSLL
jgi:hypothetical protein